MEPSYELAVVRIFARDFEAAVRFYADVLGMELEGRADHFDWAQFRVGPCSLAIEGLAPDDPEAPCLIGRFVGVSLRVSDIRSTYRTLLARGVDFVAPPEEQPWGGTLAHLRDPEGNVLTLLG